MKTTTRKRPVDMELMPEMCGTCPFRKNSPLDFLRPELELSAMTECSRICHSTGGNTLVHPLSKTKSKSKLCRGARDAQLAAFHAMGFLDAPTDEAWARKCQELGIV